MNPYLNKCIKISLIISLIILLFISSAFLIIFNSYSYEAEFKINHVDSAFRSVNLPEYNSKVLNYLLGYQENMPKDIELNSRELSHMRDVRSVFMGVKSLAIILLIISAIFLSIVIFFSREILGDIFYFTGISGLVIATLMLLCFAFAFDAAFYIFHLFFFEGSSWQFFDTDNLIQIYPSGLFENIAVKIFILSILFAIFNLIGGVSLRNLIKNKSFS